MYAFFGLGGDFWNPSVMSLLSVTTADWLKSDRRLDFFLLWCQVLRVTSDHWKTGQRTAVTRMYYLKEVQSSNQFPQPLTWFLRSSSSVGKIWWRFWSQSHLWVKEGHFTFVSLAFPAKWAERLWGALWVRKEPCGRQWRGMTCTDLGACLAEGRREGRRTTS